LTLGRDPSKLDSKYLTRDVIDIGHDLRKRGYAKMKKIIVIALLFALSVGASALEKKPSILDGLKLGNKPKTEQEKPQERAPEWVALIDGASIFYDKNYKYHPDEMKLSNGILLRGEEWDGFLKSYIETFPPAKREVILQGITRFCVDYDKVDKIIRFEPLRYIDGPYASTSYISFKGTLRPNKATAFVVVQYYGDDWIFADGIKVVADDYTWQSPKLEFSRDNYGGNVWEFELISYSDPVIAKMIDKVISSKVLFRPNGNSANER